ncbi:alpha-1,2-fucosyltransferase [Chitinophaga arvensicola]|uniref:Glycosyl transferase family 11 n=1 Tax=Chitinophaga arvensicola TaxID=29529 RepID=A0A1I0S8I5_9BACT|nr:alpha-1,2-fucosyltransferase [Chitinophaga arvensicola]SEW52333.1 Glycosyl transferase family 11 [Chitinophaga arvensicola]
MIALQLFGGLGNQMFQYALGRHLSTKYNLPLFLNKTIYEENRSDRVYALDVFKLGENIVDDPEPLQLNAATLKAYELNETDFTFDEDILTILDDQNTDDLLLVISGYWQSFKYFEKISSLLKQDFVFVNEVMGRWKELMNYIQSVNAIMINVRRSDYLTEIKSQIHGVVSIEYIEKGMQIIRSKVPNPVFFVFSDGMDWCKENISASEEIFFVDEKYYDPKFQFYLQLMVNCKHYIISNSTFAWWSAWLCKHEDKIVICPATWFATPTINTKDLIPPDWLKI